MTDPNTNSTRPLTVPDPAQNTQEPIGILPDPARPTEAAASDPLNSFEEVTDEEALATLKERRAARRRKKLIRRGIAAGVVVVLLAAGAAAAYLLSREPEPAFEPVTDIAFSGTYQDAVSASGSLEALSSTVISPAVDGTISEVRVSAGQTVAQGDTLLVISNPDLDAAVEEAKRAVQAAQADLAAAKRARTDAYNAAQGQQDAAAPDLPAADDAVAAAERALEGARAGLDQAVAKAAERVVSAPISGSVIAMNAQVGASPAGSSDGNDGASGPLMQIADLSQMKVTVQVSEQDIARVAVGQAAQVSFPAFSDLTCDGTVQAIASVATGGGGGYLDPGSVTFAVDILIPHPDPRLKPGMTAQVTLITQQLDNVVMVPSVALQTDDGTSYYVLRETDPETHATERVDVAVAAQNADWAVVGRASETDTDDGLAASPLSDGDTIVISGAPDPAADGGTAPEVTS